MASRSTILTAVLLALGACRQQEAAAADANASPPIVVPAPPAEEQAPAIRVSGATVVPGPSSAAIYLTIVNAGGSDTLTAISAKGLGTITLHQSQNDGGVMRMREVATISVPAEGEVKLAPMGLHGMIAPLAHPLRPGDSSMLTLHFERQGEVELTAPIRAAGGAK